MYELERSISFLNDNKGRFLYGNIEKNIVFLNENYRVDNISKRIYGNEFLYDWVCYSNNIYKMYNDEIVKQVINGEDIEYSFELKDNFVETFIKIVFYYDNKEVKYDYCNGSNFFMNKMEIEDNILKIKFNVMINDKIKVVYKYYKEYDVFKAGEEIEICNINGISKYRVFNEKVNML